MDVHVDVAAKHGGKPCVAPVPHGGTDGGEEAGGRRGPASPWGIIDFAALGVPFTDYTVAARRIICREQEFDDVVPVICGGWAASVVMLSDGSRQITAFHLPGDLVSTALLFDGGAHCAVEAVTEVHYRTVGRAALKARLFDDPALFERLARAWVVEKSRADQLIVDLGRRTADERIARLILNLVARLGRPDAAGGEAVEMEFPLRQHHIADATGLTPVHVSKVLSEFRRGGLIRISERALTILDPAGFRRVADMR